MNHEAPLLDVWSFERDPKAFTSTKSRHDLFLTQLFHSGVAFPLVTKLYRHRFGSFWSEVCFLPPSDLFSSTASVGSRRCLRNRILGDHPKRGRVP